jgi:hypothetical protein
LSTWINENFPDLSKWVQANNTVDKYGIMNSNMSEVYNGMLKGVRALSITTLIAEIWNWTLSYIANIVQVVNARYKMNKQWSEKIQRHLDEKAENSKSHWFR